MRAKVSAPLIVILLVALIACANRKSENDNKGDQVSVDTGEASEASAPTTTLTSPDTALIAEELFPEKGEIALEISSKKLPIANPYNFELNAETIRSKLGSAGIVTAEDVASTEDYPGYTIYTVTGSNSQVKFGNNIGSHYAEIQTRALPLKNGIVVGMSKPSFIQKMSIESPEASKATLFKLYDDYGYMNFFFKADTLSLIRFSYDEGD
jgi:hypothetical protein